MDQFDGIKAAPGTSRVEMCGVENVCHASIR